MCYTNFINLSLKFWRATKKEILFLALECAYQKKETFYEKCDCLKWQNISLVMFFKNNGLVTFMVVILLRYTKSVLNMTFVNPNIDWFIVYHFNF